MGYSIHIPLPGGRLKIKTRDRLRWSEITGETPTQRITDDMYLVWERRRKTKRRLRANRDAGAGPTPQS
ncbi:MAG: hypothetical protein U1E28_02640 [Beijerinckiaceae bacterium]